MRPATSRRAAVVARRGTHPPLRIAVALCLLAPASAFAQTPPPPMDMHDHVAHHTPAAVDDAPAAPMGTSVDTKKLPSADAAPDDAADAPVDRGAMQGMDHDGMDHRGMDQPPTKDADDAKAADHAQMDHGRMDHGERDHRGVDHGRRQAMSGAAMPGTGMQMDMDATMDAMQGGSAPADARDPDYSDGITDHHMSDADMATMDMHDDGVLGSVLIDQLEAFDGSAGSGSGQAIDAQAWIGTDLDKLWLKADGERSGGRLEDLRTELLWNRAVSTYWNVQAGVRHDLGEGPSRSWAAIGVQGLSPYWFDVEATAYLGQSGRSALRVEAEYELLLTQRLILQPDVEVTFHGRDDRARGIGSGLSDLDVGLRLRYEFSRKFAPYVGVSWSRKFGNTADIARDALGDVEDTRLVAGVRLWF